MKCSHAAEVDADWVFGYGSLIWNPDFDFEQAHLARAWGYHRAFCVRSTRYRGTPERPGVVLGLDRGGSCIGVAYRLMPDSRTEAIERLFAREIPDPDTGIYLARQIAVELPDGTRVQALTFVADRGRHSYQRLSDAEVIERLHTCHGQRGPNRDYAINTWDALRQRGVHDARLLRYVRQLQAGMPAASGSPPALADSANRIRPATAIAAASPPAPRPSGRPSDRQGSADCAR